MCLAFNRLTTIEPIQSWKPQKVKVNGKHFTWTWTTQLLAYELLIKLLLIFIWSIEMHSDRGLFAAAGIVFAFSMLWTMAILIPDKSASARPMDFVAGDVSDDIIVHAEYPRIVKSKVSTPFVYLLCICPIIWHCCNPLHKNRTAPQQGSGRPRLPCDLAPL